MESLLKIPAGTPVNEIPRLHYWLEDGIIYSLGKKGGTPVTVEQTRELFDDFVELAGGNDFCLLADVTYSPPNNRDTREYVAHMLPRISKALALISASPRGVMVSSIYVALKPTTYPIQIFNDVEEAKNWLKQYLPNQAL